MPDDLNKAWALAKEAMQWGAAQTGVPVGTVLMVVAGLFVLYKFAGLLRRGKE
jgi:hypothetical protein